MNFIKSFDWVPKDYGYVLQAFLIILVVLTIDLVQRKMCSRLHRRLEKTANKWDDALVHAAMRPLTIIIWATGISLAAQVVQDATDSVVLKTFGPIRDTVIIAALIWFLIRFIKRGEEKLLERDSTFDPTTVHAIVKLLHVSVLITGVLVCLQTLGYSISGVLAFGGIGGIALGFAAKDLLANFFGGLTIYLDRPFAVGDWVRSPDRDIEGTVEDIGWRLTRIRTFDQRPLYIPNSVFTTIALENPSRMFSRRIYETIGIRYQDAAKMDTIIHMVKHMLTNHPEINTDRTLIVNFNSFAPSSLDFFVYTFTKTTNWVKFHEIKQDVLLKILKIIETEGADCAFPTSTIHLSNPEQIKQFEGQ